MRPASILILTKQCERRTARCRGPRWRSARGRASAARSRSPCATRRSPIFRWWRRAARSRQRGRPVLLLLPAALALQPQIRTWVAFGLGGLPGALFLAGYNHALYGTYLTSGYGDVSTHVRPASCAAHVAELRHLGAGGGDAVGRGRRRPALAEDRPAKKLPSLLAWAGVLLVFYLSTNPPTKRGGTLRFILPALPALVTSPPRSRCSRSLFPSGFLSSRCCRPVHHPIRWRAAASCELPFAVLLFLAAAGWMLRWGPLAARVAQIELDDRTTIPKSRALGERAAAARGAAGRLPGLGRRSCIIPTGRSSLLNLTPEHVCRSVPGSTGNTARFYAVLFPSRKRIACNACPAAGGGDPHPAGHDLAPPRRRASVALNLPLLSANRIPNPTPCHGPPASHPI